MKLTEIENRYKNVAQIVGGVFLLRPSDAVRFVDECKIAGIPILGIEGFRMFGEHKIQPQQEHTRDFDLGDTHSQARKFLKERNSMDIWFEVVTADRE